MRRIPIVIVADDFGRSAEINAGIVRALDEQLVTCTSLMATAPAFEQAVELAHGHGLATRIGAHLNLVEGISLSEPIRNCPRFATTAGTFVWQHRTVWNLSASERESIATEWRAQIARIVTAGIQPSHIDSHTHTHTAWPIGTIAIALAREFGIRQVRLSRNCGPEPSAPVRAYKTLFNARLRRAGVSAMQYFGSAGDVAGVLEAAVAPVEVMTHPQLADDGREFDHTDGTPLAPSLEALGAGDRRRSYAELLG